MSLETVAERAQRQEDRFFNPIASLESDLRAVYIDNQIVVGLQPGAERLYDRIARPNTGIVVGVALGDEGKGRIVDNKIQALLQIPGVELVYVDRYQGGSNSGHTVEVNDIKLALHQVPSGVFYPEVVGIMDKGMVIHPEDLRTEVESIEEKVGDLRGKLFLSEDAILVTDLERAEEQLNRLKDIKAGGGTGRGMAPGYSHYYDRLGRQIFNLLSDNWREDFSARYDRYAKEFALYGLDVSAVLVPDYKETLKTGKEQKRAVGNKEEFLDRLESTRTWLIERQMVANTHIIHLDAYQNNKAAFLGEGAQAVGLHPWEGTYPDVAQSDTTAYGIQPGTGVWRVQDIKDRVGIFKLTYTSSVGARHMPTEVPLPKDLAELPQDATPDQLQAAYIRVRMKEFGTTTGRPRDILHLDLAMLTYNCRMAGIEVLAGTHLDAAREGEYIKVCTHYTDKDGRYIPYQPGLRYLEGVVPHYIELPGWDGEAVTRAKSFDEYPENAKKFLAFLQRRMGYPIVAATGGPKREHMVTFPGYMP